MWRKRMLAECPAHKICCRVADPSDDQHEKEQIFPDEGNSVDPRSEAKWQRNQQQCAGADSRGGQRLNQWTSRRERQDCQTHQENEKDVSDGRCCCVEQAENSMHRRAASDGLLVVHRCNIFHVDEQERAGGSPETLRAMTNRVAQSEKLEQRK